MKSSVQSAPGSHNFLLGPIALIEGFFLFFRHKKLRRTLYGYLLLQGSAFIALLSSLLWLIWTFTTGNPESSTFGHILGQGLRYALILVAFIASPVFFTLLQSILAPLYKSRIFEKSKNLLAPELTFQGIALKESISLESRRLFRFAFWSILFLVFWLIPGIGQGLYIILETALAAYTLGWDLMGYHMEAHGLNYKEQRQYSKRYFLLLLSTGLTALVLLLIPFLNFFFITTNTIGMAKLSIQLDQTP